MMNSFLRKKNGVLASGCVILCVLLLLLFFADAVLAAGGAQIAGYIDKTYEYEKGSAAKVLTEDKAKKALTADTDLLILAAGRDVGRSAVTDDEFSTYLGYVN